MGRSTTHYADSETNNILKRLHNKLRPAGTPVERVEYIIELLLLRIFEAKLKQEESFKPLRNLFTGENYRLLFSHLLSLNGEQILSELNKNIFPFYSAILSKARTVVSGNLPQKMQDQLVLMEEIFANSNFTNNVKGGVIAEVIGMVNEIDEKYILKTDLLGDAIESALSETGGTKDLGLYRTPEHIRQMMVEMVDPDFTDRIFDPACGTAGFLFDAYDYVIEKARQTRQFPAEHIAKMFYRTGIGGIEYQGRIRKMAAVNMYIRGLNPHNIDQGDSLKMYDPSRDGGSKSVVIANPPFGAERDQPAYPNVWEEYSKESETTILFVKLMFDLLQSKGRCAVVVSEGFLTWGQNSACALRKLLLNEANLRAVISLPQGVFVSKSGQGAKTSILYFEKGQPTDFIWYYKIENDGFSMGTNRKAIEGSQISELLELFKKVKQDRKPNDTKHSFCVSKEQIEALDPRVAQRIRKEVSEKTKERNIKKRAKLVEALNKRLKSKKISKEIYDEKLRQFDNVVDGQVDNEITKAIEKAHSYDFNLRNYRSNLSEEQMKDWRETLSPFTRPPPLTPLVKGGGDAVAGGINFSTDFLAQRELIFNGYHLPYNQNNTKRAQKLRKNMTKAEQKMWYKVLQGKHFQNLRFLRQKPIDHFIVDFYCAELRLAIEIDGDSHVEKQEYDRERTDLLSLYNVKVVRYSNDDVLHHIDDVYENLSKTVERLSPLTPLVKGGGDAVAGGIKKDIEKRYQTLQTANPKTALQILASFDPKDALQMDIAREYLSKLEKKDKKLKKLEEVLKKGFLFPLVSLKELIIVNGERIKPADCPDQSFTVLGVSNQTGVFVNEVLQGANIKQAYFKVHKNQFCYNPYRINIGSIGLCEFDIENQIISGAYNVFSCKESELNPKYLEALFNTKQFLEYVNEKASGGVRMDFKIEYMEEWQIPLPPLEIQNEIVEKIAKQKQIIEGAERIIDTWEPSINESQDKKPLKEFIVESLYGISSPLNEDGKYPVLRMNNLDTQGNWHLDDLKYVDGEIKEERRLKIGDFLFNRTNSKELVGKSGVIDFNFSGTWAGYLIRLRLNEKLSPYYLRYLFAQKKYRNYFSSIGKQAGGQANINADELAQTVIDYYPLSIQRQIVEKLDRQMQALDGVRFLKEEAKNRIEEILVGVWGE